MMFLDCPAYLHQHGTQRCGLPAEVGARYTMRSTDGPRDCARMTCLAGHHFNGPVESLTWDDMDNHNPGAAGPGSRTGRDRLQRGHGRRGSALRDSSAEPDRKARRPNGAPTYYLGRPAVLWITAMRPTPRARRLPAPRLG